MGEMNFLDENNTAWKEPKQGCHRKIYNTWTWPDVKNEAAADERDDTSCCTSINWKSSPFLKGSCQWTQEILQNR